MRDAPERGVGDLESANVMTAPHKPSCVHLTNVAVVGPHQVCFDGTVYLAGETVVDVLVDVAENWIANGWAEPASTTKQQDTAPAKPPPPARKGRQ